MIHLGSGLLSGNDACTKLIQTEEVHCMLWMVQNWQLQEKGAAIGDPRMVRRFPEPSTGCANLRKFLTPAIEHDRWTTLPHGCHVLRKRI